jgi:hypothetical protein
MASADDLTQLLMDLRVLVDAGLVVEVRGPGEPCRYAISEVDDQPPAREMADRLPDMPQPRRRETHEFALEWPEPCPACGAREGFDGGGRCRRCRIAWPPEM